jgi:hypothetical protein
MEWCSTKFEPGIQNPEVKKFRSSEVQKFRILCYGDRIVPGKYLLHSRFRHAINFLNEHNLVSLVDTSIGFGPFNIVIDNFESLNISHVIIGRSSILLDKNFFDYRKTPRYDSSLKIPALLDFDKLQINLHHFKEILKEHAPSGSLVFLLEETKETPSGNTFDRVLRERFIAGTSMIIQKKILEGVKSIRGVGLGLTPSGDDFVAGLLIALHIQQLIFRKNFTRLIEDIFIQAQNGNPLSTAFLRSAKEGRVFDKLQQTISALFDSEPDKLLKHTINLLTVGATSGADIAIGLIYGLINPKSAIINQKLSVW